MRPGPQVPGGAVILPLAAKAIASAINEVIPDGYSVIASWVDHDPMIILVHDGVGVRGVALEADRLNNGDESTLMALLEGVLAEALNQFQDEIVDELHAGWPPLEGAALPLPGTRAAAGVLHGWYGEKDCPALALRPIHVLAQPRGDANT